MNIEKNKNLFILSYKGAPLIEGTIDKRVNFCLLNLTNTKIHIIDNGNQNWETFKNNVIYTTKYNIGCSGGYSLILKIAFDYLNLDKIIISNDDNLMSDKMLDSLLEIADDNTIVGAYDRSFEFSCFAITRNTYEKVGGFDENIIFATEEDTDYKIRCKHAGVKVLSLMSNADSNLSYTCRNLGKDIRQCNTDYVNKKWGTDRQNPYDLPFNGTKKDGIPRNVIIQEYQDKYDKTGKGLTIFPSYYEFEFFKVKETLNNLFTKKNRYE